MENIERRGIVDSVTRAAMRQQSRRGMLKTLGTWGLALGTAAAGVSLSSTKALASPQSIRCEYGQCSWCYSSAQIDWCQCIKDCQPGCNGQPGCGWRYQAQACINSFGQCTCNYPNC